jgi:hypothetical protein
MELCDESLDYTPYGIVDIWRGNYRGNLVCIKAIRIQDPICLNEIKVVCGALLLSEVYSAHFVLDFP